MGIHGRSSNTNISQCLAANPTALPRIRKELDDSNGDYEYMKADRFGKKRTSKFDGEILAMINNDPRKSTKSIASDMGVSDFLIRQVVHEDISYFSYKMRKNKFFITDHEKQEDCTAKHLNTLKHPLQPNIICFFSVEKNFCQD